MKYFYDTCALLNLLDKVFSDDNNVFYVSNISFKELENIKTSPNKDQEIKYRARKLIHLLDENKDKYTISFYNKATDKAIEISPVLIDNNDSKIILSAKEISLQEPITFVTSDLSCRMLAEVNGLKTKYVPNLIPSDYTGFKTITFTTDEELAEIYDNIYNVYNPFSMLLNEYLIIKDDNDNQIVDSYKYVGIEPLTRISYDYLNTKTFGEIKPKDVYQILLLDSFKTNKMTLVRGPAGAGKSYLALGFLFSQLEKQKISKIIIFCNTIATAGSAKLGFYPGSRLDKLLDSQIGNFLASKLGSKIAVEQLISEERLELLPLSDIRGYDTTGANAGVYITEAQNLDVELMKLALQRVGEDSICIIDGDTEAQVDSPLYAGSNNGMRRVSEIFRGDLAYGEVELQNIYRSHIAELAELL